MHHPDHRRVDLHAVSLDGSVTLAWGDSDYRFRLGYGELGQLEEACGGIGAPVIADALRARAFRVAYVRETIRLGLIGGGLSQSDALNRVRRFVEAHENDADYFDNAQVAYAIIQAALSPRTADTLKKAIGTRRRAKPVPRTAASTSPSSTPPA